VSGDWLLFAHGLRWYRRRHRGDMEEIDWIEFALQCAAMTVIGWFLLALAYVIFTAPLEPPELEKH
jgi:hypothetical protein